MVCLALAWSTARWAPFSAGLPLLASLPDVGSSVAILMVFEPVVGVEELPLLVVPAPQASSSTSSKGMPIVKAKIRDQLLFMMRSASFNIIKYKSLIFTEGPIGECSPQRLATPPCEIRQIFRKSHQCMMKSLRSA